MAGGHGLSRGPGIITCKWLRLSCSSPKESIKEPTTMETEVLVVTATEVLVCFGLLLITVQLAAASLCLVPLHQSNTLMLQ